MLKIIMYFYYVFSFPLIYILSSFKEEDYIDGIDIKNACIAHRALVVDDTRDFTITLAIILLIPCVFFLKKYKLKSIQINTLTVAIIAYSIWRFYIRLNIC